ncbi:UNVERIFIED_CONTAM: hypothetical protein Sindi_1974000 [Sesamum indicum]
MSSSSSSNSKSRPGSGSSATHSESTSGSTKSVSGSASESASKSVSGSSHGSYSTSPKRNKKFPISKLHDEHVGPSTLAKFQDRLAKNPWEAVVSKVRTPVLKIREKYHIPSDFDIIIPAAFDHMHRPPEGFSVFSIKHLDAELRFPLAPPVATVLNKLGLCPMQLSPNSITHIILFVVIMQFVGLEPSFDNFWSLYSFTTSNDPAMTFLRSLSLKCTHYRRSFIQTDQKVQNLKAQLAERDEADLKHADNMLVLGEKVQKLEAELDAARKEREILLSEKEVALAEAKKEAFEAGREVGLVEGHKHGVEEGQAGRVLIEEYQRALADSRMSAVCDFLKTDTFTTALEIKSTDSFAKDFETCHSQIAKLSGFHESFDYSKLDISLDGDLQPLPTDPELKDDEFMALRDELEVEADA